MCQIQILATDIRVTNLTRLHSVIGRHEADWQFAAHKKGARLRCPQDTQIDLSKQMFPDSHREISVLIQVFPVALRALPFRRITKNASK
jgi:hypothetical protein